MFARHMTAMKNGDTDEFALSCLELACALLGEHDVFHRSTEVTSAQVERALSRYIALDIARLTPFECMHGAIRAALVNDEGAIHEP